MGVPVGFTRTGASARHTAGRPAGTRRDAARGAARRASFYSSTTGVDRACAHVRTCVRTYSRAHAYVRMRRGANVAGVQVKQLFINIIKRRY